MSWRRQLTPAVLRRVTSSLYGSCSTLNYATFLSGARYTSRFSPTPNPSNFDLQDILGKALEFKGLSENKSPADMWADKSDNLKLPPPPDAWTGRRIAVRNGNLQGAFQQLNLRLRHNHVAKEIALTVRHEKKGDKRARLRSERWRKRFADAACTDPKKVQLVSTIRRRGG
ncbi:hypothetical protein EV363DRAFT_1157706 [Boletus edulis]|nr:hypothetical protein EV363DRAFT_1157706 [Boletus edulis]